MAKKTTAKIKITKEWQTNICPSCNQEFILLAIRRGKDSYGMDDVDWYLCDFMQHIGMTETHFNVYCPLCGHGFRDKKLSFCELCENEMVKFDEDTAHVVKPVWICTECDHREYDKES